MSDPLDALEMIQALRDIAQLARAFYVALVDEGFNADEALTLTCEWLSGLQQAGGA